MHTSFFVSEMYKSLDRHEDNDKEGVWRNVWNLKRHERVKYLVWLLVHDMLLTNFLKIKKVSGVQFVIFVVMHVNLSYML